MAPAQKISDEELAGFNAMIKSFESELEPVLLKQMEELSKIKSISNQTALENYCLDNFPFLLSRLGTFVCVARIRYKVLGPAQKAQLGNIEELISNYKAILYAIGNKSRMVGSPTDVFGGPESFNVAQ